MTTAENIQSLLDGGYKTQALRMADTESISIEEVDSGVLYTFSGVLYTFPDGSTFLDIAGTIPSHYL